MADGSPLEFVQYMEWKYKLDSDHIVLQECPICHNSDWKFYMNASTGMWDCKHLNAHAGKNYKGSLVRLRKILGLTLDVQSKDAPPVQLSYTHTLWVRNSNEDLLNNPVKLADICDEWAITPEVVKYWKIGWWTDPNGREWILIPHLIGGELYNVKQRTWFGYDKMFFRVKGASSVMFNEDCLFEGPKEVILTEGEKDAMLTMWALGTQNVLGMTGGAGTLNERWFKMLEGVETIYLAYDGDPAGSEGMDMLVRRLGSQRIKIVTLPQGKDCADVVKDLGPQALRDLFAQAKPPQLRSISQVGDILEEMITSVPVKPLPAPSKSVTRILNGGTRPGQVIVVTAPPKIGKTSYALAWSNYVATRHGVPALLWCVEMPPQDLAKMTCCIQYGTGREPNPADMLIARNANRAVPLYIGHESNMTMQVLIQTFKDAYCQKGIRFFVFDNIHFMVRNAENKVTAIEDALKEFKSFAMEYNIHLILIAQPSGKGGKKGANMDYYDIGWSSSFASDADTIIILHRDRIADSDNSFRNEMMVKVDAGRYTPGGVTYVNYYAAMIQFADMSRNRIKSMIMEK